MTLQQFLMKNIFFFTREAAFLTGKPIATASRQLKRLAEQGAITPVTRGVWANTLHPYYSPYGAIPYLLNNEHGYLSLLSALHRHGLISQIPRNIQVATTGFPRKLASPIGTFEFFRFKPDMFRSGVNPSEGKLFYLMASPEKALLDTFYLASRKGHRFSRLPELDLENFNSRIFKKLLKDQVPHKPISLYIQRRFEEVAG